MLLLSYTLDIQKYSEKVCVQQLFQLESAVIILNPFWKGGQVRQRGSILQSPDYISVLVTPCFRTTTFVCVYLVFHLFFLTIPLLFLIPVFPIYFFEPLTPGNYFFPLCDTKSLEVVGMGESCFPHLGEDPDTKSCPLEYKPLLQKSL